MNDDDTTPRPWTVVESREAYRCPIFRVRVDRARSPRTGLVHDFTVVEPDDAVAVIALTPRGGLVLVEQYRFGTGSRTLELPGGVLHGDAPAEAALRELYEETGCSAGHVELLGTVDVNPSWQSTRIHVALATGVEHAGAGDPDPAEDTLRRVVPFAEWRAMVADGRIRNTVAMAGLCLLEALRGPAYLPPAG